MIRLTLEIFLEAPWENLRRKLNGTLIPECTQAGPLEYFVSYPFMCRACAHKCMRRLTGPSRGCLSGRDAHWCALWEGSLQDAGPGGGRCREGPGGTEQSRTAILV